MTEAEILNLNVFMMCEALNPAALRDIPEGYTIRTCRKEELDIWKGFPFDTEADRIAYSDFMSTYFEQVYGAQTDRFFETCLFLCDKHDQPVATCFAWKAYGSYTTIHWFKVRKELEDQGLGRAMLSEVMRRLEPTEFPVYLHTQAGSFRAIHLYRDFGFSILTDPKIGTRENQYEPALSYLRKAMGDDRSAMLRFVQSDGQFSAAAAQHSVTEF